MNSSFFAPQHLGEALQLLAEPDPPMILAGGTDLWPQWSAGQHKPARVLSVHRLEALRQITVEGPLLRIGATSTHSDLRRNPLVQQSCPALGEAASTIGATQIQEQGTIGGNLVNASPAADLPPPLAAAGAQLELVSLSGTRQVSIENFFLGYRQIDRRPQELLAAILVPILPAGAQEHFRKVGTRRAQAISKVVGSARIVYAADRTIAQIGLAFGSVAPTTIRLHGVEQWLAGQRPDPAVATTAAQRAAAAVHPIDDLRSSADYRRHVVGRLVYRWLLAALG